MARSYTSRPKGLRKAGVMTYEDEQVPGLRYEQMSVRPSVWRVVFPTGMTIERAAATLSEAVKRGRSGHTQPAR